MQYPALYVLNIDTIKLRELLRMKGHRHCLMHGSEICYIHWKHVRPSEMHIATCTPIARQRVGKKSSLQDRLLVNSPFLGHAKIDDAAFSMRSVPSNRRITGSCKPFLSNDSVNTLPRMR
jgi:hypothetical protein